MVSDPQVPAVPVLVENMDKGSFFFLVFHDLISKYLPGKEWKYKEGLRELDVSTSSESGSLPLPHLELAIRVRASTIKCEAESFWSFSFKKLYSILDWVSKKANVCPEQTSSLRQDGGRKRWDQAWRRRELPGPFLPKGTTAGILKRAEGPCLTNTCI